MKDDKIEKINFTILEVYYILMIIFKLLNYEITFSNKILGWLCIISVHLIIVYISFKKINDKGLNRILILALIQYIVNAIKDTNIFLNFMLLITNIIIYYSKRIKAIKKDRKKFISLDKEENKRALRKIIVIILIFLFFINLVRFFFMILLNLFGGKYYYEAISPDSKYEVYIEEIPTGAWSSFRNNICLYQNKVNLGLFKIQTKLHNKVLASSFGEIIAKWDDNQKFSLWEKSSDGEKIYIDYICEYTINSFINSDSFINARNIEFRDEMLKLKTVEDLTYEDNTAEENSLEEENDAIILGHEQAYVWIMNSKEELLMQRINQNGNVCIYKPYISVELNSISGGKEKEIIKEELKKAINTEIDIDKLEYLFSLNDSKIGKLGTGIYLLEMDLDINSMNIQEEVSEVLYINYKNLWMMIKNEEPIINPEECKMVLAFMISEKYIDIKY